MWVPALAIGFSPPERRQEDLDKKENDDWESYSHSLNKKIHKNINKPKKIQNTKAQKDHKTQNPKTKSMNSVPIFSANGAGVVTKSQSLVNNVDSLGAGIITLQETHLKEKEHLMERLLIMSFSKQ